MKKIILAVIALIGIASCSHPNYDTSTRVLQLTGGTIVFVDSTHILFVPSTSKEHSVMYNLDDNIVSTGIQIDEEI